MTSLGSLRHWPLAPLLYGSYLGQKIRLKLLDFLRKSKCPAIARDAESMTNAWWLSINGPVKPSKSFGKVVGIICIFFNLLHSRTKNQLSLLHHMLNPSGLWGILQPNIQPNIQLENQLVVLENPFRSSITVLTDFKNI